MKLLRKVFRCLPTAFLKGSVQTEEMFWPVQISKGFLKIQQRFMNSNFKFLRSKSFQKGSIKNNEKLKTIF